MNRREFASAASAATLVSSLPGLAAASPLDTARHRFGVNYTLSRNWWFCWNHWQPDPILRDLNAIASLGADHLRLMLLWPRFRPNLHWVSPAHLDRFDQLPGWMEWKAAGR